MLDNKHLESKFMKIGARLKCDSDPPRRNAGAVRLNVLADREGEFFEIRGGDGAEARVEVLDVQPRDRHLLLLVREGQAKAKFLCGHDERHWFVAAIPEAAPVGTVIAAKEALKPPAVRQVQALKHVDSRAGNRRKNDAFRRQGEWFFVPTPSLRVDPKLILRDEPLSRGRGSKPHLCEYCFRTGGQTVYVTNMRSGALTASAYRALLLEKPEARGWNWTTMRRNPLVYVRGRVRHADHKTITLHGWHQVLMNTENQSVAMRNVAFLD